VKASRLPGGSTDAAEVRASHQPPIGAMPVEAVAGRARRDGMRLGLALLGFLLLAVPTQAQDREVPYWLRYARLK